MTPLATLKEILFDKHRPWLQDDKSEDYFQSQLLELKQAPVTSGSSFVIDAFPRPFNSKTRYYKRFIDNELQKLLKHYFEEILAESNNQVLKYHALTILERQLKTLFADLSRIITEFDFSRLYRFQKDLVGTGCRPQSQYLHHSIPQTDFYSALS
jgi:hypothetical protein